ncbi:MAG: multiple sugar transport system permease protein [Fusobacteriaceae bacterium]|jgi:multiple sugar transport system permease protein|nr:multiple sugar transport system permease protein [Fusobacteriaceae bacterium]
MDYKTKRKIKRIVSQVILWIAVIIVIFPIIYLVAISGSTSNSIRTGTEFQHISLHRYVKNFIEMQKNANFFNYFKNSLIVITITTFIALTLSIFAGYALAKFKFPGSNLFGITMLSTQLIPPTLILIPMYLIFITIQRTIGLQIIDTYYGLIIPYVAIFTPMSIWVMRGFFANLPSELEEAARIDGCSRFQAFRLIMLPLATPGVIATGIFIFLTAWDELMLASVLTTSAKVQTIPIGIRLFIGRIQNRFDLTMMAALVITIPVAIIFFALQKYFVQGMTAGAVKG